MLCETGVAHNHSKKPPNHRSRQSTNHLKPIQFQGTQFAATWHWTWKKKGHHRSLFGAWNGYAWQSCSWANSRACGIPIATSSSASSLPPPTLPTLPGAQFGQSASGYMQTFASIDFKSEMLIAKTVSRTSLINTSSRARKHRRARDRQATPTKKKANTPMSPTWAAKRRRVNPARREQTADLQMTAPPILRRPRERLGDACQASNEASLHRQTSFTKRPNFVRCKGQFLPFFST